VGKWKKRRGMKILVAILLMLIIEIANAQEEPQHFEQQIENETAADEFTEIELEEEKPEMKWYKIHKVDINDASTDFLVNQFDVPAYAAIQLLQYRKLLGDLIDIHELQAVPGWDRELVTRILPYIKVGGDDKIIPQLKSLYKKGTSYLQLRTGTVTEKSKGYKKNELGVSTYAGNPLKLMFRYRFTAGKKLQWGYTAEKDAGEKFVSKSKSIFNDYHSFYVAMDKVGKLETFIIGDFEINMGQGLIHWQSVAFKKSASSVTPLRQGYFAIPHKGLNEQLFHRGIAMVFKRRNILAGFFSAFNHWDGNIVADSNGKLKVSSIQVSGLHRTTNEIEDKNALKVLTFGSTLRYQVNTLQFGINAVNYNFSIPLYRKNEPENLYAIKGKHWLNFSLDYRFTFRNFFFFGELAHGAGGRPAILSGIMAVLHPKVDISVVLRNLPPSFKSINGNAFTEQAEPGNENGLYFGVAVKFSSKFILNGYADVFNIPMIKARTPAPARGHGHLLQLSYKPDKRNNILLRLTVENKQVVEAGQAYTLQPLVLQRKSQLRIHQQMVLVNGLTFNSRVDWVWLTMENGKKEMGYQVYADLFWKPPFSAFGIGLRASRFDTDSYASRIYSAERDVRNLQSVNLSAGRGWRNYFLLHYKIKSCVQVSLKVMRSYYTDNQSIGTGNDEINRSSRSEYRLQFFFFF
jgi:hypothetical protein